MNTPKVPTTPRVLRSRSVLVADDDEGVRRLIGAILGPLGLTAELCKNGREALLKGAEGRYSLLILDCDMPHLTRPEVVRHLRERGQRVPVILMSAADPPEDFGRGTAWTEVTFLAKPFGLIEFRAAVEMAGTEGRGGQPLQASDGPESHA